MRLVRLNIFRLAISTIELATARAGGLKSKNQVACQDALPSKDWKYRNGRRKSAPADDFRHRELKVAVEGNQRLSCTNGFRALEKVATSRLSPLQACRTFPQRVHTKQKRATRGAERLMELARERWWSIIGHFVVSGKGCTSSSRCC
jgi:hypothetical protein